MESVKRRSYNSDTDQKNLPTLESDAIDEYEGLLSLLTSWKTKLELFYLLLKAMLSSATASSGYPIGGVKAIANSTRDDKTSEEPDISAAATFLKKAQGAVSESANMRVNQTRRQAALTSKLDDTKEVLKALRLRKVKSEQALRNLQVQCKGLEETQKLLEAKLAKMKGVQKRESLEAQRRVAKAAVSKSKSATSSRKPKAGLDKAEEYLQSLRDNVEAKKQAVEKNQSAMERMDAEISTLKARKKAAATPK